ncbi:PAAR domain-containing protein [Aquimarina sp. 2-A2]|uniref:PAAR domain-containing protein n=1 Tax=Aquimarina sp. 2-A2 TaxID=3382644 RepID=UPI00387F1359
MPGPAATIGSMHTCPMCTGSTPHVGGPITGPGIATVLIGNKPAAVMGDMCTCSGPPDTIAQGCGTVLIGGKPAATVGDMTAHGGVITVGEATVLIGTGAGQPSNVMPLQEIPFPNHDFLNRVRATAAGENSNLNDALANQASLAEEAAPENRGYLSRVDFSI